MTNIIRVLGVTCLVLLASFSQAQKDYTKEADQIFDAGAYHAALDAYKKAYSKEKKQSEKARILYRIGESYRQLQDEAQAQVWFDKAIAAGYDKPEIYLHYGQTYMMQSKYDEAMEMFRKALNNADPDIKREAEKGIVACEKAIKMQKNPARYVVRNEVQLNSKYLDFSPYFADKKFESILFTSTRPSTSGNDADPINGEPFSDIFFSQRDNKGKWSAPVPLSENVNTPANEGTPNLDRKYSQLYFTRCGYDKNKAYGCQIYTSRAQGRDWAEAELLDFGIDDTSVAAHPAVIEDDLILYVSDITGGQGGKDLWYIRYDKKSKFWGPPVNLGPEINTPGNEMFPYIHENGDLYFASDGHPGMGGLDIYRCPLKGDSPESLSWGKPENLGAPINSSFNDFGIIYEGENDRGYFSSDREGGKGGDDIYSFAMPPLIFKIEGTVTDVDTKEPLGNVKVKLLGTDGTVGETTTDPTGHYVFEERENGERYIKENTSYTIEVTAVDEPATLPDGSKHKYLGAKGQETTVGLKESTAFIKDFELLCADCDKDIKMPLVLYPLGKWDLLVNDEVNSKDSLEYLYNILVENPTIVIELAAHTDTRGNEKANQILSQKRAETCVNYLIERGIDPARMVPVGYGESKPIVTDEEIAALPTEEEREAAHQKNRRTVFRVISFDYVPPKAPAEGTK
ncbi:MAG: OmpA family protein [Salibacteraceae bacterium]